MSGSKLSETSPGGPGTGYVTKRTLERPSRMTFGQPAWEQSDPRNALSQPLTNPCHEPIIPILNTHRKPGTFQMQIASYFAAKFMLVNCLHLTGSEIRAFVHKGKVE